MVRRRLSVSRQNGRSNRSGCERKGAMIVLLAVLMMVLLAMVAFAIDVSYMQLTRSELRSATDAAAKAAASTLAAEQDDGPALAAAIDIAGKNFVGGKPLTIDATNVLFGQSQKQADGSWTFVAGAQPYRAVQVNVDMSAGTTPGPVDLFFGRIFNRRTFSPQCASVASHLDQELCLVIDRSHSMCFDLSGTDWRYPSPIGTNTQQGLTSPPLVNSRWDALEIAISDFLAIVATSSVPPRMALVTWASDDAWSPAVSVDVALGGSYTAVDNSIKNRGNSMMIGATNMAAGMDKGIEVLTAASIRPLASRIMVLMSDGQWNQGRDPVAAANDAKAAGIIIHTISFLSGASQASMQQVASITGGKHFFAGDKQALQDVFREIALTLPIALTQ